MKKLFFLLCFSSTLLAQKKDGFITFFEKGNGNQSATYEETIRYFNTLDASFETIKMQEMGLTDSGEPLHIVTFNADSNFSFKEIRKTKSIILINNGIHAGEPDGIDATMMLFRDLALGKIKIPKNIVLVTIPVYNIGGALNRNSTSRANQNGPEEYGFRGNARNFDLNRDFIKSDTRNTKSFVEIFHLIQPVLFIDNHVSNGADYQYTLTYIMTEPKKLGNELGTFLKDDFNTALVADLKKKKTETTPYVNVWHGTPDDGFQQFFESPRYATGYTSLFDCLGYVVETHMLKDYASRVKVTYDFMVSAMEITSRKAELIQQKQLANHNQFKAGNKYTLQWKIDSTQVSQIPFMGYQGGYKKSDVTSGERLYYDRKIPFTKYIPFWGEYQSEREITIPNYYVIPKGQWTIIEQLKANQIELAQLKKDTIIQVESYSIADYQTYKNAYEGHYPHYNTKVNVKAETVAFKKGDYIISTDQKGVKFLLETLEPEAIDSYFNWNYFDAILQQKEGYSSYVFEDLANEYLNQNPQLRVLLEEKKKTDKKFSENPEAQLDWVYKNSPYYEKAHLRYPVYRIMD
ncbi:MAG: M14 family metallopeptidase [Flavobacterium sp.]|nr:M14 family metallopeptidase [Flavobacterium sp.]